MRREVIALLLLTLALYISVAIIFFSPQSYPGLNSVSHPPRFGSFTAHLGYYFRLYLGWIGVIIPILVFYWIFLFYFFQYPQAKYKFKIFFALIFILSLAGLGAVILWPRLGLVYNFGGVTALFIGDLALKYFGRLGGIILFSATSLISAILVTDLPLFTFIIRLVKASLRGIFLSLKALGRGIKIKPRLGKKKISRIKPSVREEEVKSGVEAPIPRVQKEEREKIKIQIKPEKTSSSSVREEKVSKPRKVEGYTLPPIELLNLSRKGREVESKEDLHSRAQLLEDTLRDFGIEAKVVDIERGPVITRYELQPAPGVKVQWIASLAEDIALVMKSYNVHVSVIPGRGTVGVEVPNTSVSTVYLREIINSQEFQTSKSLLTLALGKKVSGEPLVSDLGQMPHLLIAGATGSGKTVCINALIISLLYKASPDELRLILIDPKMVELSSFNDLPHLVVPVIHEPNLAVNVLDWAVGEMENRYQLLSKAGTRNIEVYNQKKDKPSDLPQFLPYLVIIIDELADLMLIASKEIESHIARLAQLSRAVGIHMILATQRPSVDVITGVIKANFPSRISFKVASKVDSRTVLDMNGADKLLGKGDMLFIPPGGSKPVRAQGSLVTDEEIHRVVDFIKQQRTPVYDESILESGEKEGSFKSHLKRDKLYEEAVNVVLQTGQASVSILQRRLGIGYTRAARLIDMMEEDGIVGPYQGSKPREILIDREEYLKKTTGIPSEEELEEND
jgi:S-DNA-T family DNA segregation ATPase FtsK/SpoIIIE